MFFKECNNRMNRFVKSTWFKAIVGILVALLVFLIIAAATSKSNSPLSSVVGTVMKPVSHVSSSLGRGVSNFFGFFRSKNSYKAEIKDLEGQIADYQKQLVDYEKLKQTNKLYEDALGVKEQNDDYEFVAATVIGRDAADVYTSFTINRGSKDGVEVKDPVIYGKGQLVGLVTKVSTTYSVVSTILDPNVSVSAYEVRTRETGYISNETSLSATGLTKLSGLNRTTSIAAGGIVCTSGVGGIYPRDLVIGTVAEVRDGDHDISSFAVIKPGTDIKDIEDVLVITSFNGQGVTGS